MFSCFASCCCLIHSLTLFLRLLPSPVQELKGLTVVLDTTPAPFCIELAALAARREYLNMEKWLSDQFTAKGSGFMQSTVSFLDSKLRSEQPALQVRCERGLMRVRAGGEAGRSGGYVGQSRRNMAACAEQHGSSCSCRASSWHALLHCGSCGAWPG